MSKAVGRASLGLLGGLPRGRVARGSAAGLFCPSAGCGGLEGFLVGGAAAFSHEHSGGNRGRLGKRYGSGKLPRCGRHKKNGLGISQPNACETATRKAQPPRQRLPGASTAACTWSLPAWLGDSKHSGSHAPLVVLCRRRRRAANAAAPPPRAADASAGERRSRRRGPSARTGTGKRRQVRLPPPHAEVRGHVRLALFSRQVLCGGRDVQAGDAPSAACLFMRRESN